MKDNQENLSGPSVHPDWNPAKPEVIPQPTIWPASLALSATLGLWGLASSLIISLVGVGLFVVSLAGWIRDIRYERRTM